MDGNDKGGQGTWPVQIAAAYVHTDQRGLCAECV